MEILRGNFIQPFKSEVFMTIIFDSPLFLTFHIKSITNVLKAQFYLLNNSWTHLHFFQLYYLSLALKISLPNYQSSLWTLLTSVRLLSNLSLTNTSLLSIPHNKWFLENKNLHMPFCCLKFSVALVALRRNTKLFNIVYNVLYILSPVHVTSFIT